MLQTDEMKKNLDVFDKENFDMEALNELNFEGTLETSTIFVPTDLMNLSKVPDDYDYDMEASHSTFFWDELLPTLIVYCLTFVLGLVGNVLIIFTISRYRKMKSTTNVFLASLASSDLLLILFCIPVKGVSTIITSTDSAQKKKPGNVQQSSNSVFQQIKAALDAILRKEAEEQQETFLRQRIENSFYSNSTVQTIVSPYVTFEDFLTQTTSKSLCHMQSNFWSSNTNLKLEPLIAKISEEINKYSDFINQFNDETKEKLLPYSLTKLSARDRQIELNHIQENGPSKKSSIIKKAAYPVFIYPTAQVPPENINLTAHHTRTKRNRSKKKIDKVVKVAEEKLVPKIDYQQSPCVSESNESIVRGGNEPSKEFLCCENCKLLKTRIIKLEEDLEKIQKIMPFYPKEHQDSIKNCLESLNVTSGTFLKKLKSYTKMRYSENCCHKEHKNCSKRSTSAPEQIVHDSKSNELLLEPNSSDYHVNVAMGITMENVDPVTGEKLGPDVDWENEQGGNIQCKLFKDNEKPLLVMDTNFSYNPKTGMLFSKKEDSSKSSFPEGGTPVLNNLTKDSSYMNLPDTPKTQNGAFDCLVLPVQSEFINSKKSKNNSVTEENIPLVETYDTIKHTKRELLELKKPKSKEIDRNSKKNDTKRTKTKSLKSLLSSESCLNLKETVPESGELKKNFRVWFGKNRNEKIENSISRIPIRKATASSAGSKADSVSQKSSMTSFVINPLLSDCLPSTSETPKMSPKLAKLFSFTWTFGFFLCKLVHYMQSVSAICSVLTLTAMSLERYYAIVHPMKAQYICTISQARRIISATWVSAFLLAVPILFAQVHLRVGVKVEAYWCVRDWDNKTIWRAHELYMMLLILVVPTGVMAIAYTAICCEIWEVIQRRQDMTSGKGHGFCRKTRLARTSSSDSFSSCAYANNMIELDNKRRSRSLLKRELADDGASVKQVIKMLVAVVVIYVICWGPMLIDNVLQAYGILSHIRMGWLKYMGTTFHLLAYFNSCINPIIYGFMSKNFRESFRKTLCCVGKKSKTAYRSFSLSQTRNTSIRYAESSFGRTISIALPV